MSSNVLGIKFEKFTQRTTTEQDGNEIATITRHFNQSHCTIVIKHKNFSVAHYAICTDFTEPLQWFRKVFTWFTSYFRYICYQSSSYIDC